MVLPEAWDLSLMPRKAKRFSGSDSVETSRRKSAPSYWLFKTEPETHSWERQKSKGRKGEPWDGVRNFMARNNMVAMRLGDLGFFYHSGEGKEIVGVVEVAREHFPDPTDKSKAFVAVDMKAVAPMPKRVTLAAARGEPQLAQMALLKQSRLSVQPVTAAEWKLVCAMGGLKGF